MRLARLTALERGKIEQEYLEVIQLIEQLRSILASPQKMLAIIQDEVRRLKEKYGDARKTQIIAEEGEIGYEDTIEQKDMVITISHAGYIKRQEISSYRSQRRGGKGVIGARTKEEDYLEHLFIANTHAYLLFLTDKGRCYWLKVHEIEQAGRMARGRPLVNHLEGLSRDERVQAVVAVKEFDDQHFLVCATKKGLIKKTALSAYSHPRKAGINAILLEEGDALIEAIVTDGTQDIIIAKKKGLAVRFHENEARPMGRTAYGVKARLSTRKGTRVVSMVGVRRQARFSPCARTATASAARSPSTASRTAAEGHHHDQDHGAERRCGGGEGSGGRRRAHDHHSLGPADPHAGGGNLGDRPQHPGRAAREPGAAGGRAAGDAGHGGGVTRVVNEDDEGAASTAEPRARAACRRSGHGGRRGVGSCGRSAAEDSGEAPETGH
jgi:DNA gyrase/topoisomerase IV subunit A